ncbi:MAG: DUF423 domain-containing protein [Opitutaceae bacterium]
MTVKKTTFSWSCSIGAILGFLGVLAGAFGAHALKPGLIERGMLEVWQTAVLFHLLHAIALCALGWTVSPSRRTSRAGLIATSWTLGILLFSGSLYLLALGGPRLLGPVTPIGGLFLLSGWALAVFLRPATRTAS